MGNPWKKQLFVITAMLAVFSIAVAGSISSKISSKKAMAVNEKLKPKFGSTKTTTTTAPLLFNTSATPMAITTELFVSDISTTTDSSLLASSPDSEHHELESPILIESTTIGTNNSDIIETTTSSSRADTITELNEVTAAGAVNASTSKTDIPNVILSSTDVASNILPCTCGVFLGSQFTKGSQDVPKGEAVISNSLERSYACNGIGQRQCQTKCLEQIVQHLPNSANILCASLDRDITRERAYLFIKNCSNEWINTNLAAGREYCCKNRKPVKCSIK